MDIGGGNKTNVDDSVGKDPNNREDVGPDVETSLGQHGNSVDVTTTGGGNKDPSYETAPETNAYSGKSVKNFVLGEGEDSEEVSKGTEDEEGSEDKEKNKNVVDVDELDLDDIPLTNTLGEGVAKRLRSNKGIVVTPSSTIPKKMVGLVTGTPKSKINSTRVGPKKGWSKVSVKNAPGSSRKRKVIPSSESEYDVEEDVINTVTSVTKISAGKKNVQLVENVPIDKVSFHLPEFAQRWKFICNTRLNYLII